MIKSINLNVEMKLDTGAEINIILHCLNTKLLPRLVINT